MIKQFYAYEEIPLDTQQYIMELANASEITQVALWEINDYFHDLYEHEKLKAEDDWSGGWVV